VGYDCKKMWKGEKDTEKKGEKLLLTKRGGRKGGGITGRCADDSNKEKKRGRKGKA